MYGVCVCVAKKMFYDNRVVHVHVIACIEWAEKINRVNETIKLVYHEILYTCTCVHTYHIYMYMYMYVSLS